MFPNGQGQYNPQMNQGNYPQSPMMPNFFEMQQQQNQYSLHNNMQQMPIYNQGNFYENLVNKLSKWELSKLSDDLKRGVDADLQSRQEWDQKGAKGIKQLGLVVDNKGSQDYSTASGLFSGAFMQAILNSLAQYCSVLLPPGGPARVKTMNTVKDKQERDYLIARALEVSNFTNNLLTDLSPDYYPESEQTFFWTLLFGSCFKKGYFDQTRGLPVSHLIKPQDLIINNTAISLLTAPRITHRFYLSHRDLKLRQMTGFYADVPIQSYKNYDDSPIKDVLQRIEGITRDNSESISVSTDLYQICETRIDNVMPQLQSNPNIPCPYLASFEYETGTIISLYRNWEQHDPFCKRINDLIHFPLIPGPGIYGLGYIHIMGSNAEAATELLRQLIFSGRLSNFPAFIRAKGMRMDNSTIMLQPGQSAEIETGNKSVQDCLMKVPFGEPSPALKQIKDDIEQNIGSLANSVNANISDFNPNTPVGTTYAMIDQASKVESSIIRRLHKAQSEELNLIYKLIYKNFDKIQYSFMSEGKTFTVTKEDFQLDLKILPTSDPNLATSTHLLMQSEALSAIYTQFPQLINPRAVAELRLKALKISDIDTFMIPDAAQIEPRPALIENMDLIEGKPVKAGLEQNHQADIMTHSGLLSHPSIVNDPNKLALVNAHIQEHYSFEYQLHMQQLMGGVQITPEMLQNPEVENQIAVAAAQATQTLVEEQQAMINGQPQQPDPTQVLMADIQSKKEATDQKAENDFLRVEIDKYKADLGYEAKIRELEAKYHLQESQQTHEQNLQDQQIVLDRITHENELIKSQIDTIMSHFENLSSQERQQQHEREMQLNEQMHQQIQNQYQGEGA